MQEPRAIRLMKRHDILQTGARILDYGCGDQSAKLHFEAMGFDYVGWDLGDGYAAPSAAPLVNLSYVLNTLDDPAARAEVARTAWRLAEEAMIVTVPPGGRLSDPGAYRHRCTDHLGETLRAKTDWNVANIAWLRAAIPQAEVTELGPDVYLLSRGAVQMSADTRNALTRRETFTWLPRVLGALAAMGFASAAFGDTDKIFDRVAEILNENYNLSFSDITLDAHLTDTLGFDSLDTVTFILELETEYDIGIPDAAAEQMLTVGDVVDYLRRNVR